MKNIIKYTALPVAVLFTLNIAHAVEDCNAKRSALEYQISQAKKYGNEHKVKKLELALDKVNRFCTQEKQIEKANKKMAKLEKKLADKKVDARELEIDLNKAIANGVEKKIAKLQAKIADTKQDILEIEAELAQLKAEIANM